MWSQAVEYLLKAIESNPQLTAIIMQNATVYKQIFASPVFGYSLANETADAQSDAYILLLSSLRALGQYDKMLVIASNAIARGDLHKKDAFYYYAGIGFLGLDQTQKAFLFFQKSLSIEKNNPDVYFYIAEIYQKTSEGAQARNALGVSYSLHQKNDPRFPYDQNVDLRFF
jgi:tetratricopeptide (TPR) repeat protein